MLADLAALAWGRSIRSLLGKSHVWTGKPLLDSNPSASALHNQRNGSGPFFRIRVECQGEQERSRSPRRVTARTLAFWGHQ